MLKEPFLSHKKHHESTHFYEPGNLLTFTESTVALFIRDFSRDPQ